VVWWRQFFGLKIRCVGILWKLATYPDITHIMTQFTIPKALRRCVDVFLVCHTCFYAAHRVIR
jgi:hypothetical protein